MGVNDGNNLNWFKCPECKNIFPDDEMERNWWVCPSCGYHERLPALKYLGLLFGYGRYRKLFEDILPADPLNFVDLRPYSERIIAAQEKTGLTEAIVIATGRLDGHRVIVGCMDFDFIGGSMGSVVGERVACAFEYGARTERPVIMITRSGGARMMESAYSLMQLSKTLVALKSLKDKKVPYIVVLCDPTTGGVTASFAMMGDITIAERGALIGFAGPRVIKETTGMALPEGFQRAEYLEEHGFVDMVIDRRELKGTLSRILDFLGGGT